MLLGLAVSFNSFSSVLLFIFSVKVLHLLGGEMNGMAVSAFFWSVRYISMAYIINPYLVLLIDVSHGLSHSLFRVSIDIISISLSLSFFCKYLKTGNNSEKLKKYD